MDDSRFMQLLDFMDASWKGYRKVRKGVKKRISRHMQELDCRDMADYIERLSADEKACAECKRLMGVSISRFFRDRRLWVILEKRVLPELVKQGRSPLKIWFAGCAGGEEVYSFRILWEEFSGSIEKPPELRVLATDINPEYLERARTGIYPAGTLREVDETRLARWFSKHGKNHFAIAGSLQQDVYWKVLDHLKDALPPDGLDIVFLRNSILTYYPEEVFSEALARISAAIAPYGFLIIGAKEEIPDPGRQNLLRYDRYIYRKTVS